MELTLDLRLGHSLLRFLLPLSPPAREWWTSIDHVTYRPEHPLLIRLFGDIIIWTDYVELVLGHLLVEVVGNLFCGPGTGRLLCGLATPCLHIELALDIMPHLNGKRTMYVVKGGE